MFILQGADDLRFMPAMSFSVLLILLLLLLSLWWLWRFPRCSCIMQHCCRFVIFLLSDPFSETLEMLFSKASLFVLLLALLGCFAQDEDPEPFREYISFDGWCVHLSDFLF